MTTKEIGISLHEELDRREALIQQLTEEANAIRVVLGVLERPSPEQHNRVTRVIGRRGRKKKALPPPKTRRATDGTPPRISKHHCAKHPGATFDIKGYCKMCKAEYNKEYNERRKLKLTNPNGKDEKAKLPLVKCDECGDRFPDAKAMGIHKTRVHFGAHSERRSTLD